MRMSNMACGLETTTYSYMIGITRTFFHERISVMLLIS